MKVTLETIPHSEQRYETAGDWFFDEKGDLTIRVSALGDWRYEMLVKIHELIEVVLCKHQGVSQQDVDKFDFAFEENREKGNIDEPGDSQLAPYTRQHCLATAVERMMAAELDVAWNDYAAALEKL